MGSSIDASDCIFVLRIHNSAYRQADAGAHTSR
jgi:hypothetical protein